MCGRYRLSRREQFIEKYSNTVCADVIDSRGGSNSLRSTPMRHCLRSPSILSMRWTRHITGDSPDEAMGIDGSP